MAKKNNTAEKALLNAEEISKALKESTEKTLKSIVSEAINDFMTKDDAEDNDAKETEQTPIDNTDDFEVEDVETDDVPEENGEEGTKEGEGEAEEGNNADETGADDEWAELDDFKVGDNDYDFTGEDGEMALKVYNKLGDDDQIFIKKEDDGTYTMEDEDTGAEYVIELGNDGEDADAVDAVDADVEISDGDEEGNDVDTDIHIETDDDDAGDDEDEEFEVDLSDLGDDEDEDENEDTLNEDLGYTDNYQGKNPIDGLKNNEVAPNGAKDWNNGIPTDAKKPWAGKGDSDPFDKTVNECGTVATKEETLEEGDSVSQQAVRKQVKTKLKQHRPNNNYEVAKEDSPLNESVKKIVSKAKAIQAENKQYRKTNL